MANPLLRDRDVDFLLYEVNHAESLCALPAFAGHGRDTFDLFLDATRRLARGPLFSAYRPMDEEPPRLDGGRVRVHPVMRDLWPRLVELGIVAAARPEQVGGQQLPLLVHGLAAGYLMAANAAAYGYAGLTTGAAHLLEEFGSEWLQRTFMTRMYAGEWTGTMALTEPHAGSSLADVATRARPVPGAVHYLIEGSKVFISGGDQDVTGNIVHLVLARIEGAPAGIKGVSLFCVPRLRPASPAQGHEPDAPLVDNDCRAAGVFHKMGWKGLPSIALSLGEGGDCHGWLVGPPGAGIAQMFQMMNEARLMVGMNAAATASAAYHEAVDYALARPQGRTLGARDPSSPQVPIMRHTDVRRMLLRQKAIVEGSLSLLAHCQLLSDLAHHAEAEDERRRAALLLDLLTPVAKTFPAERGYEANALSVQVHGGYGYTSEYRPEAWLRDQKLNTIHEGTSGIQALDLLGRKALGGGGAALLALGALVTDDVAAARSVGLPPEWADALSQAIGVVGQLTAELAGRGAHPDGGPEAMLLHAADYLDLFSTVVIAWQHLRMATAAARALHRHPPEPDGDFYRGKLTAARYFIATDLPRIHHLAHLCRSGEESYADVTPAML